MCIKLLIFELLLFVVRICCSCCIIFYDFYIIILLLLANPSLACCKLLMLMDLWKTPLVNIHKLFVASSMIVTYITMLFLGIFLLFVHYGACIVVFYLFVVGLLLFIRNMLLIVIWYPSCPVVVRGSYNSLCSALKKF